MCDFERSCKSHGHLGCDPKRNGNDCVLVDIDASPQTEQAEASSLSDLLNACSPMPWRLDKMNAEGIEVVDAVGDLVYVEDFGMFPDEMSGDQIEQIITKLRANAFLMVKWSESI